MLVPSLLSLALAGVTLAAPQGRGPPSGPPGPPGPSSGPPGPPGPPGGPRPRPQARAEPLYPHDIQGPGFTSPLAGQNVTDVQGIITAIVSNGCYIQTPQERRDRDDRTSEGLFVFGTGRCAGAVGDLVSINGTVSEYTRARTNLRTTELSDVTGAVVVAAAGTPRARKIEPLVIGKERSPPTEWIGVKNQFELPANTSTLESGPRANSLDVENFGSDFWESLEGMLVTLQTPTVLGPLDRFNNTYLRPAGIPTTSGNARGGLTLAAKDGVPAGDSRFDANPEAIEVGEPLDGTFLPLDLVLSNVLADTTGIVSYDFSTPVFLPLTAPAVINREVVPAQPTNLTSSSACSLTVAGYNVENMSQRDGDRIAQVGQHIDQLLRDPDVIALNEIQDDSGATNNGVVNANRTLTAIIAAIKGAPYAFTQIDPQPGNVDGGAPGGNIRPAFLYRTDRVKLAGNAPAGNATQAVSVSGSPAQLSLNPGRIAPADPAWRASRKPIVAQFEKLDGGAQFFVVAAHFTSKGGSTDPYGPTQPPTNGGVQQRIAQASVLRNFVEQLLAAQSDAAVILAGDFNEFSGVQPLDELTGGGAITEIAVAERVERWSYIFGQNAQQIDHVFAAGRAVAGAVSELVHANTIQTDAARASDHDPVIGSFPVC